MANFIFKNYICLPSSSNLKIDQIKFIVDSLNERYYINSAERCKIVLILLRYKKNLKPVFIRKKLNQYSRYKKIEYNKVNLIKINKKTK